MRAAEVGKRSWDHLSPAQRRAAVERGAVVILPLAATEQHGPHLPLSTDVDIAEGILGASLRLLDPAEPAFHLPVRTVGVSLEHEDWPGTLSVTARELEDQIVATGRRLSNEGVRRLVLFNSHGGNKGVLDTSALRLRVREGLLVVKANYFRFPRPPGMELPDDEWTHGLHGGALETAMMLYLHPERVDRTALRRFPSLGQSLASSLAVVAPEGVAPFAWTARDLNPDGVTGDASLADAAMGQHLATHYAEVLAQVIRDTLRFPLQALTHHAD